MIWFSHTSAFHLVWLLLWTSEFHVASVMKQLMKLIQYIPGCYWHTDTAICLGSRVKHCRAQLVLGWMTELVLKFLLTVF